jgi:hypothetical protein
VSWHGIVVREGALDEHGVGVAGQLDYRLTVFRIAGIDERAVFLFQSVGDALGAMFRRSPGDVTAGQIERRGTFVGEFGNFQRVVAFHPDSPHVQDLRPEFLEWLRSGDVEGTGAGFVGTVVHGEEKWHDVYGMVGVKVGEEDAVDGERVQVCVEHSSHCSRTQVEDEGLVVGAHHYATLASGDARYDGSGADDGYLHFEAPFLP